MLKDILPSPGITWSLEFPLYRIGSMGMRHRDDFALWLAVLSINVTLPLIQGSNGETLTYGQPLAFGEAGKERTCNHFCLYCQCLLLQLIEPQETWRQGQHPEVGQKGKKLWFPLRKQDHHYICMVLIFVCLNSNIFSHELQQRNQKSTNNICFWHGLWIIHNIFATDFLKFILTAETYFKLV